MNARYIFIALMTVCIVLLVSCRNKSENTTNDSVTSVTSGSQSTDPKGIGKFRDVTLTDTLDKGLVTQGQTLYGAKCQSCHLLTDEKVVGPGWQGITKQRTPEWLMNFMTNTDEMLDKDTAGQNMLEKWSVRMPNQELSDADARALLEFMRQNDTRK
jgi:mono/diheme cytochrome c family protein